MSKVYITVGLPGSGKSSWAYEFVENSKRPVTAISLDDLRLALFGHKKNSPRTLSKGKEKQVVRSEEAIVLAALERGEDVVVHDTHLGVRRHHRWAELIKPPHELVVKKFPVSLSTAIHRDQNRAESVGESVVRRLHDVGIKNGTLDQPHLYQPASNLPEAVLVDLDGTLALLAHRSPYSEEECETDEPNVPVLRMLSAWQAANPGCVTILCTGRRDLAHDQTVAWLRSHNVSYDFLYMRRSDDMRADSEVKMDIFDESIKDKFDVVTVFDDRQQVVDMWRHDLGLTVFQVAPGNF